MVSFISYPQRWYRDIFIIKETNKDLQNRLVLAELLIAKSERYKLENESLKKMLEFKESNPFVLIPANVTNKNSSSIKTITVDVGVDIGPNHIHGGISSGAIGFDAFFPKRKEQKYKKNF